MLWLVSFFDIICYKFVNINIHLNIIDCESNIPLQHPDATHSSTATGGTGLHYNVQSTDYFTSSDEPNDIIESVI